MNFAARLSLPLLLVAFSLPTTAQQLPAASPPPLTPEAINAASLEPLLPLFAVPLPDESAEPLPPPPQNEGATDLSAEAEGPKLPDPAIARLQILLDRAGVSPGVIDGYDGANVRKAVMAFAAINGLPGNGALDPAVLARLETPDPAVMAYTITAEDVADIVEPLPSDYAELAERESLGYTSVAEALAEKFHMDVNFIETLNPGASFVEGEEIAVAAPGADLQGMVATIEADKRMGMLRAYDATGRLLVAYPATIGSEDNPSPSGTHMVEVVVLDPDYTYNPEVNFQQGDNTEVLTLPPGPNGPVGTVWIDLSEPTYGIHGTPEPSKIDKTGSHGCVRLTNWDARELAAMVEPGVPVTFIE
ncbi:L,D-transpeptidase family protein [Devosia sp. 1566]|uniref:L,D-transpeptidase family protein n=1 Tax=Devosia sp. 1566 TaxID=2499144 RepID=UPI000FD83F88|nr:L,D-transpeptidase family protein [Devosia sp. 1566]